MKNSILNILGVAFLSTSIYISCDTETEPVLQTKSNNLEAAKRGEIACSIKDRNGNEIAAGTRCGTPTGSCGRYSNCKALTSKLIGELPKGMTYEEFVELWNDDTRREQLVALGYYEEDIK